MDHTPRDIGILEFRVTYCAPTIGASPVTKIAQEPAIVSVGIVYALTRSDLE